MVSGTPGVKGIGDVKGEIETRNFEGKEQKLKLIHKIKKIKNFRINT